MENPIYSLLQDDLFYFILFYFSIMPLFLVEKSVIFFFYRVFKIFFILIKLNLFNEI